MPRLCQLTEIQDELDNLHDSDIFLPPDADAPGALEVVPVHDNVDHQIQHNHDPGDGGLADELSVAKKSRCAMMVGVEESWKDVSAGKADN